MSTFKGKNVRLTLDEECVAAALSCTLHVGIQTDEVSTKDSEDDYSEIEVVGKSWDVQGEALYIPRFRESGEYTAGPNKIIGGKTYQVSVDKRIHVKKGETFSVFAKNGDYGLAIINAAQDKVLAASGSGSNIGYSPNEDCDVYPAFEAGRTTHAYYTVQSISTGRTADEIIAMLTGSVPVQIALAITSGIRNSEVEEEIVAGTAYITDFTLSSSNKQRVSYNFSATGVGELSHQL